MLQSVRVDVSNRTWRVTEPQPDEVLWHASPAKGLGTESPERMESNSGSAVDVALFERTTRLRSKQITRLPFRVHLQQCCEWFRDVDLADCGWSLRVLFPAMPNAPRHKGQMLFAYKLNPRPAKRLLTRNFRFGPLTRASYASSCPGYNEFATRADPTEIARFPTARFCPSDHPRLLTRNRVPRHRSDPPPTVALSGATQGKSHRIAAYPADQQGFQVSPGAMVGTMPPGSAWMEGLSGTLTACVKFPATGLVVM